MNGDDKRFLDERLIKLETKFDERWTAHDKSAAIRHECLDKKFSILFKKVDTILTRKEDCMNEMRGYTNKTVGMIVGVPVTILILFKLLQVLMP